MKRRMCTIITTIMIFTMTISVAPLFAVSTTLDFTSLFGGNIAGDKGTSRTFDGLTITAKIGVGTNVNPWAPPTASNPSTNNNSGGVVGDIYWGDLGMLGTTALTIPISPSEDYFGLGVLKTTDSAGNTTGPITFKEALVFDFALPQDPKNSMLFGSIYSATDLSFRLLGTNLLASGGTGTPADNVRVFLKFTGGEILPFDINAGALSPNPLGNPSPDALDWNYWIRWALNQVNYTDEHIVGLAVEQIYGTAASPNRQFGFGSITYDAPTAVPEPTVILLLSLGIVGVVGVKRKLRK